ncbi:MAG: hypothetical protein A2958_03025 [Candidatus Levybacteria bacterium RIFCSPLOWO2_01_FULL_38_13]|nr:MAG: hypothetical protein A2629_03440 [Candidatus Levybacteria bacterium RIFCSPHIGHO2_01_FULL_41_15]OGH35296.1 MAG: hypothetical protein A2958_03025 [Candidatus Levybacteria bacterium RIFCSPLOWO2_01_FULL_38_13]
MGIDKTIVAFASLIGALFTFWFFLMKKDKVIKVTEDSIDITIDGGYSPEVIEVSKGKKTKINFLRKDPSGCLEEVVLPDFNIRKFLPLNQKVTVEINPKEKGEFKFSCGMNMFHGKIIVGG